ncbi:Hypothetical predicted protein [Podarcis lilfordi]|uniref:Uncharacterized protein n=1 Tax=Podarcis lilfordi TaxID=74358 RepID=A0AA35PV66_9SAUR|nr:Hypothetical predicted protein [Podarcis lilfordi]
MAILTTVYLSYYLKPLMKLGGSEIGFCKSAIAVGEIIFFRLQIMWLMFLCWLLPQDSCAMLKVRRQFIRPLRLQENCYSPGDLIVGGNLPLFRALVRNLSFKQYFREGDSPHFIFWPL